MFASIFAIRAALLCLAFVAALALAALLLTILIVLACFPNRYKYALSIQEIVTEVTVLIEEETRRNNSQGFKAPRYDFLQFQQFE